MSATVSPTRSDVLAAVRAALARGEYLEAFDETVAGRETFGDDVEIAYLAVLALVRAGATGNATKLLAPLVNAADARADLPDNLVEDIAALEARLAKDRAVGAPTQERRPAARIAAELYEEIYRRLGRPYTCVNAASMWLVAGEHDRARALARAARALVAALTPGATDADAYWLFATDAEAALVLGEYDDAARSLARAAELVGGDLARAATTRQQLSLICTEIGADPAVLAPLAPPRIVHYCGHMIAPPGTAGRFPAAQESEVAAAVANQLTGVALGFGSLACGADILYAEALLDRGAELHVHLPCAIDDFVAISVGPGGPGWRERFQRCLDAATSVSIATAGPYLNDPELFAYCSRVAMGHALIRADFLAASAEQLAVWDGRPPAGVAGTAVDVTAWAGSGRPTHVISVAGEVETTAADDPPRGGRTVRAMLFADLAGFSRLDDSHIPAFLGAVMQPLATVIERFGDAVLFRNTWGDGIYLVFRDVVNAAACALEMQTVLERVDLAGAGLPDHLAMRVAAHAGPVLECHDPIQGVPGFYGVEVTRAARMEPRTPEGAVYVTDQFAALLTLEPVGARDVPVRGAAAEREGLRHVPDVRAHLPELRPVAGTSSREAGIEVLRCPRTR